MVAIARVLVGLLVGVVGWSWAAAPAGAGEATINTDSLCAYEGGEFIDTDELFVAPCLWVEPVSDTPWLETYVVAVRPTPLLGISSGSNIGRFGTYTYAAAWVCLHGPLRLPTGECVVSVQENV